MISRGQIVDITLVILMFSEMHVFAQVCVFKFCLGKVEGRKEVRGESKDLKTVEILLRNEHIWFPMFFKGCPFVDKYEN